MNTPYLHAGNTKLMLQVCKDLDRHEGYREFSYPDPLSSLYKKFPYKPWGFVSAEDILQEIGVNYEDAEKLGKPWTVGYGFTNGVTPSSRITKQLATRKLEELVLAIHNDLDKTLVWYKDSSFVVKTILINMYFNLGRAGLLSFKNTLKYISQKNYKQAATNMLKSLWARQVGQRAQELARRMETQTIPANLTAPEKL